MSEHERVERAMAAFRAGRPVVLVNGDQDPEERLPLSFVALNAAWANATAINGLLRLSGGRFYICLREERAHTLGLRRVKMHNPRSWQVRMYESFEAVDCCDGGVSARDRALTVALAIDDGTTRAHLRQPGGVEPLVAAGAGTLAATGFTEAAVDLAHMAGAPAAVISELLDSDGNLAAPSVVEALSRERDLPVVAVPDITRYRWRHEPVVKVSVRTQLPTPHGTFEAIALTSPVDTAPYLALVALGSDVDAAPLVSVHRSCVGAAVRSRACDCGARLKSAMDTVGRAGGVIVHLPRSEPHDVRSSLYETAAIDDAQLAGLVLRALGIRRIRLLGPVAPGLEEMEGLEVLDVVGPS